MKKHARSHVYFAGLTLAMLASASVIFPLRAYATWVGPRQPTEVWAGYTTGAVYVTISGTGCSGGIIEFLSANSDPEKVLDVAMAALLSGKNLDCKIAGCNSNGYAIGRQCKIVSN